MFRKSFAWVLYHFILLAVLSGNAFANSASHGAKGKLPEADELTFWQALTSGTPSLNIRTRYEYAKQTGLMTSHAGTNRTRLGYETADFKGFTALVGLSNNTVLGDDFNSGGGSSPNRANHVVIADPRATLVDRAYLNYSSPYHVDVRGGRQVIVLDNQRFVGHVGFRQTWQTFDALALDVNAIENFRAYYAFIGRVNRIFGPRATTPLDRNSTRTHLINLNYHGFDFGDFIGYVYLNDNRSVPVFSNNSYGIRFTGGIPVSDDKLKVIYTLEYSYQTDTANNPVKYSTNYYHAMLGTIYKKWLTVKADWEQLGGDQNTPGKFFRFPMGTNHAFQGWADLFLVTPQAGINDYYLTLKFAIPVRAKMSLIGMYHHFTAQSGSSTYGDEVDAGLAYHYNKYFSVHAQYANFFSKNANNFRNTQKFWLFTTIKF